MTVSLENPEAKLADLVEKATAGEDVIIEKAGQPVARVVRVGEFPRAPRVLGLWKGQFEVPDDFDETSEDILRDFGMID